MRQDSNPSEVAIDEDEQEDRWVLKHYKIGLKEDIMEDNWMRICPHQKDNPGIRGKSFITILEQNSERYRQ